ncbi:MAG: hypothetical protein NZ534_13295, partial [Bacteroidia bacterium]|nr:hypothetical protein [Bacteroidia bacterium]
PFGYTRKRYSRVRRRWHVETDYLPPFALEALQLALGHSHFVAVTTDFLGNSQAVGLVTEGPLEIEAPESFPPPYMRKAKFTAFEGTYDKWNAYCYPCLQ